MSLVNLSHVCSHLQNASLARLGLTSIPYTRLHLSLSLLLQKQGFLSQVKLGGPSPPVSCFPPGSLAAQPPIPREPRRDGLIQWDQEHWKTKEQLEKDGWDNVAANFLIKYEGKSAGSSDLVERGLVSAKEMEIIEEYAPMLAQAREDVEAWIGADKKKHDSDPQKQEYDGLEEIPPEQLFKTTILRHGFSRETLQHFAGPRNIQRTERDIRREGISLNVMGLTIPNQPLDSVPDENEVVEDDDAEGLVTQSNRASRRLWLGLKYWDGMPVLRKARMLSKPTKRIWLNAREMSGLVRGKGAFKEQIKPLTQVGEVMIVSTDRGIMEVRECAERKIGGMVLCRIW